MIKLNYRGKWLRFEIMTKKLNERTKYTSITKSEKNRCLTKVEFLSLTV